MAEHSDDDNARKQKSVQMAGFSLGGATEYIVCIFLSAWFWLESFPYYFDGSSWTGPYTWFGDLWIVAGLPHLPVLDVESDFWAAAESPYFMPVALLLSGGACGLAVGHPKRWGFRTLSYLGIAAAVEAHGNLWPVLISITALLVLAVSAMAWCWHQNKVESNPHRDGDRDRDTPLGIMRKFSRYVLVHYGMPPLGPALLVGLALQNFTNPPASSPRERLIDSGLGDLKREVTHRGAGPITNADLLNAMKVLVGTQGTRGKEACELALSAKVRLDQPEGARPVPR